MSETPLDRLKSKKLDISKIDVKTTTFVEIERYLNLKMEGLRSRNDNIDHSAIETAVIRGGIKEIKDLLSSLHPKKYPTKQPKKPTTDY